MKFFRLIFLADFIDFSANLFHSQQKIIKKESRFRFHNGYLGRERLIKMVCLINIDLTLSSLFQETFIPLLSEPILWWHRVWGFRLTVMCLNQSVVILFTGHFQSNSNIS